MIVYVVTSTELGWDCVCHVSLSLPSLREYLMERLDIDEDSDEEQRFQELSFNQLRDKALDKSFVITEIEAV